MNIPEIVKIISEENGNHVKEFRREAQSVRENNQSMLSTNSAR